MSRIQAILEKAEREGAVMRQRLHPDPAPVVLAPVANDASVDVASEAAAAPGLATSSAPEGAASVARGSGALHLDPALVATGDNEFAEQYQALSTRIGHVEQGDAIHTILVTSPGTGEGKSVTVANLALTMAREHHRPVCIVDANLRSPRLHELFGLPASPGLSDVLVDRSALEDALTLVENLGVTVLPAGSPTQHPAELLGSPTMLRTLDILRLQFARVVVDTPAALAHADMGLLTPFVDRIVLVVRAGVTPRASLQDVVTTIDTTRLLGVVLNEAA